MLFTTTHIGQVATVALQLRILLVVSFKLLVGNGHNLRGIKSTGRAQCNSYAHKLTGHRLIGCITCVHVRFAHTVIAQLMRLFVNVLHIIQILIKHLGRAGNLASIRDQAVLIVGQSSKFLLPKLVGSIQVFNRPCILYSDFTAFFDLIHYLSS